jgi:predicted DsbA family dithiol-disulfide isomerase
MSKLDRKGIRTAAENANLELTQFDACLSSNKHADALRAEINLARASGITGSPTLFVGTQVVSGFIKAQELADLMGQLIAKKSTTP